MALAMHAAFKGQGLLRTTVLVPWALLTVVTAIIWRTMFVSPYGFVNTILGTKTVWLGSEPQALIIIILADDWKTAPFMALLILAGLQVIPGEVYEAAKVDGASTMQRFTKITLPLLLPAILIAMLFRYIFAFRLFSEVWLLTQGGPARTTEVLAVYLYLEAFRYNAFGVAAATGWLLVLASLVLAVWYLRRLYKEMFAAYA